MGMSPDFFYPPNIKSDNSIFSLTQPDLGDLSDTRFYIDTSMIQTAGGIDPTTGFTRRVMYSYPWLEYNTPIDPKNLPNWNVFVAGEDSTIPKRVKYKALIKSESIVKYKEDQIELIYLLLLSTLLPTIIVLVLAN